MLLKDWENKFYIAVNSLKQDALSKAGALLPLVPTHEEWDNYLCDVKREWVIWKEDLNQYSLNLVFLFAGLAFYEYSAKALWPSFANAVGADNISPNEQSAITQIYAEKSKSIGLKILVKGGRASYVGSAVYHIGIPLSLWADFLELCEWTIWHDNWREVSSNEWEDFVIRFFPGIKRLQSFLIDNRETALAFVKEMIDARIVSKDDSLTIPELARICLLRVEYFEEVPETLDFLRPGSIVSYDGLAKLFWSDFKQRISLYLPSVSQNQLPAKWEIEGLSRAASSTPHELVVDSKAFKAKLLVRLLSNNHIDTHYIKGINQWGLFDLSRGGLLVNPKRDTLPLGNYILVSKEKLENIKLVGFDETESVYNELINLNDGMSCYVTRLWPISKHAELSINFDGQSSKVNFRRKARIQTNFFVGERESAGSFIRQEDGRIKIESLPILYMSIPKGYFSDNRKELQERFYIFMDQRQANGSWSQDFRNRDEERDFFRWEWGYKPFLEQDLNKKGVYKGLENIDKFFHSPDLRGEHTLSIRALPGFDFSYKIFLDHAKKGMGKSFSDLPGEYLIWYLLCQSPNGMKWDEIVFAKEVIAPNINYPSRQLYRMLKDYSSKGLIVIKGRFWIMGRPICRIGFMNGNALMQYCGDPSIVWALYRKMYYCVDGQLLPEVKVVKGSSGLPYLEIKWPLRLKGTVRNYLLNKSVRICEGLWDL